MFSCTHEKSDTVPAEGIDEAIVGTWQCFNSNDYETFDFDQSGSGSFNRASKPIRFEWHKSNDTIYVAYKDGSQEALTIKGPTISQWAPEHKVHFKYRKVEQN